MSELYNVCKIVGVSKESGTETDDIVQEVCLQLLKNQKYTKEIYENRKTWLLTKMVKAQIYESKSRFFFENKIDFSRYQRIIAVCEKYGIEAVPANAYKVYAIIDEKTYSIPMIASLLEKKKMRPEILNGYDEIEGSDRVETYI